MVQIHRTGRGKEIYGKHFLAILSCMPEDQICVKMMLKYLKKHGVDGVDDVDGFLSWLALSESRRIEQL